MLTYFARTQQRTMQEFFAYFGQPNFFGDDMNIIQVGRPAVSRFHQQRGFFFEGKGYDHAVHDFPVAELGIKMGGFMLLGGTRAEKHHARSWELY